MPKFDGLQEPTKEFADEAEIARRENLYAQIKANREREAEADRIARMEFVAATDDFKFPNRPIYPR